MREINVFEMDNENELNYINLAYGDMGKVKKVAKSLNDNLNLVIIDLGNGLYALALVYSISLFCNR